jgi:hypothetical protein
VVQEVAGDDHTGTHELRRRLVITGRQGGRGEEVYAHAIPAGRGSPAATLRRAMMHDRA